MSGAAYHPQPVALRVLPAASRKLSLHDWYGRLLCGLLVGYAVLGKGFAYISIPPLYIGDICLVLGLVVLVRSGRIIATLASLPSIALALLMLLVTAKTVPAFRVYGLSAARDSVIVMYGLYAFVVMALLLERPERLAQVIVAYRPFGWLYGLSVIVLVNSSPYLGALMPNWPVNSIPFIWLRLGEGAVHLAGAVVFALVGLRAVGLTWTIVAIASVVMISVSRGAMLSCVISIFIAGVLGRNRVRFGYAILLAVALFMAAYVAGVGISLPGGRSIGPEQMVNGVESIFGTNHEANLNGTKMWRLRWWDAVMDYTFHGPYFWTGKGFGMSLAVADGFMVGEEQGGPPLRSPHSVHMTILARTGVPGLALWGAMLVTWYVRVFGSMIVARRRGDTRWADVFLWIGCYLTAMLVNSSFDVAMEGPMIGIWFWCLFGFGIAATMIYRASYSAGTSYPHGSRMTGRTGSHS